jgi:signal transduction histidine kinase
MARATLIGRAEYAPLLRAERQIATGRVALAAFSLLASWLDPDAPTRLTQSTQLLLIAYVDYALLVALVVWLAHMPLVRLGLVTHVVDLALFSLLPYVAQRSTTLFFAFFSFSLVAATLRWQWRGALWTAAAGLVALNGIGIFTATVLGAPAFELNTFIMRSGYLMVLAALLAYLGAHEERLRREMAELAAWPHVLVRDAELPQPLLLESAARILGAPRVVLAWEDPEEPWLRLASWSGGELRTSREAPETFHPVVAEPLAGLTFLSPNVRAPGASVLYLTPSELRSWRGSPIHPALQARFEMTAVLCLALHSECLDGHLFALGKRGMTADDLLLGEIVARQVASWMDQAFVSRRLRQAAVTDERLRLSRDLHDGVLQSLTGAALQLQTVQRLLDTNPQVARDRLTAIQWLIADQQRDLRFLIRDSKRASFGLTSGAAGLDGYVRDVVQRLGELWGLQVDLQVERLEAQSCEPLLYDVCLIIQEALVNAARHGAASAVRVAVAAEDGQLRIDVTDNGRGFPFQGEYDAAALFAQQLGPVMLKERVRSLGGTLVIHSTGAGARLDIRLPCGGGDD